MNLSWIPVSERLPEFTINNTVSEDVLVYDGVDIRVGEYRKGKYLNGAGYWRVYGYELEEYVDVIAWMPLPEPYKEGEDMTQEQYELLTKRDDKRTVTEVELAERLANIRSFCLQQCEGIKSSMVPGYYLDPSAMIDKYKHILDMIDKPI